MVETGGHIAGAPLGRRNYGLEYLRFLLAFGVMLFHYLNYGPKVGVLPPEFAGHHWFHYGRFGVASFFVISGFVIAQSSEGKSWQAFVGSRVARLWPAIVICAALTTLMAMAVAPVSDQVLLKRYLLAAPLVPLIFTNNYPDPSYWSITTELRFYTLVMVLLLVSRLRYLPEVLTALACVGFGILAGGGSPDVGEYFLVPYIPFFAVGVIFYRYMAGYDRRSVALYGGVNLGFVVWGTHIWNTRYNIYGDIPDSVLASTLIATACVGLVVGAYLIGQHLPRAPLAPLLGGMSYPLYLLHQRLGFDLQGIMWNAGLAAEVARALTIIAILAIAGLIHVAVERPLARPLRRRISAGLGGQAA